MSILSLISHIEITLDKFNDDELLAIGKLARGVTNSGAIDLNTALPLVAKAVGDEGKQVLQSSKLVKVIASYLVS